MKLGVVIALALSLCGRAADYIGAGSGRGGEQSAVDLMPADHWYRGAATGSVLWITWHATNALTGTNYVQRDYSPAANDIRQGVATNVPAIVQGAAIFDGSDRMHAATQSLAGAFTIAAWMQDRHSDSNSVSVVASDYLSASGVGWYFGYYQRRARLFMTAQTNSNPSKLTVTPVLASNTWHHVVATWSGVASDAVILYVNSTNVGTASINASISGPSGVQSNLQVGARNMTPPDSFFRGALASLRIDRWAWSAADVTNDFKLTQRIPRP